MKKIIRAIIVLTIIILCTFSACSKPNNSNNGNALVPGTVWVAK